jgi:hypothetical protein
LPSGVRAKAQRDTSKCRQTLLPSSTTLASEFVTAVAAGSAAHAPAPPASHAAIITTAGHTRANPCLLCFLFIRCSFEALAKPLQAPVSGFRKTQHRVVLPDT